MGARRLAGRINSKIDSPDRSRADGASRARSAPTLLGIRHDTHCHAKHNDTTVSIGANALIFDQEFFTEELKARSAHFQDASYDDTSISLVWSLIM